MKTATFSWVACALFLLGVAAAPAQVLVEYDFTSGSLSPTTVSNATASDFAGVGMGAKSSSTWSGSSNNNVFVKASQLPSSIDSGIYFSFTLTPSAAVDITSLTFKGGGSNGSGDPAQTVSFEVRSSLDGYASVLGSGTATIPANSTSVTLSSFNCDFSGLAAFQDVSSPVTFNIYVANVATSSSSNSNIRLDTVVVNGTLAVPEPPVAALALAGVGGLWWLSRRTRIVASSFGSPIR